jgi:pyridinium-3,5-biscarboxylic acid mononucleotide sulfurtransferase
MVTDLLTDKLIRFRQIVADMQSVLVAFSGGIDSTLVLRIAHEELGTKAIGITAVSATFPAAELESATRTAEDIGAQHEVVSTDQLTIPEFVQNDATRCFHCKTDLYRLMDDLRAARSIQWILDGTNMDDLGDDRPGIIAAREWQVRSPLVEAGFTKADVRAAAQALGLSTWDKPAAACLSSRIPRGVPITLEKLRRVERAEAILQDEGFRHFRVRDHGDIARIEVAPEEFARLDQPALRSSISVRFHEAGFRFICVDLEGYRPGGTGLA